MSSVTKVGGLSGSGLGSCRVRSIRIGFSGHGSSASSGTLQGFSASLLPWLNQSCTSNWIHAAASRFSVVAGWNSLRVSSSLLTSRGFGSSSLSSDSRTVALERDVAAEAAAEAAHERIVEVVVRPVERSRGQVARVVGDVGSVERPPAGVVEVLLA